MNFAYSIDMLAYNIEGLKLLKGLAYASRESGITIEKQNPVPL